MPIQSVVNVQILLQPPALQAEGFGIPLLAIELTPTQEALWGPERVKQTSPGAIDSFLQANGITTGEDAQVALSDLTAQDLQPQVILVGRRLTPVAQVRTYTVTDNTDGTYTITINGNDAAFPAVGQTITQIRDALVIAVNGLGEPVTAAPVAADQLTVTANEAGVPFTSSVSSPISGGLTEAITTPNQGLPEDIAAFRAERDDWYLLLETTRSTGNILAAADTIEGLGNATPKMFGYQSDDPNANTTSTTDVFSVAQARGYDRTWGVSNGNDDQFIDAALAGKLLPTTPGSQTWANQELNSVEGEVFEDTSNLDGKNANWLELFRAPPFSMTRYGRVASGQFIDLIRGRDFAVNLIQTRVADLLRTSPKVAYTDQGIATVGEVIRGALRELAAIGLIIEDSIVVNVPTRALQTAANIGNRILADVTFSATLQGAIHTVQINGTLAP